MRANPSNCKFVGNNNIAFLALINDSTFCMFCWVLRSVIRWQQCIITRLDAMLLYSCITWTALFILKCELLCSDPRLCCSGHPKFNVKHQNFLNVMHYPLFLTYFRLLEQLWFLGNALSPQWGMGQCPNYQWFLCILDEKTTFVAIKTNKKMKIWHDQNKISLHGEI